MLRNIKYDVMITSLVTCEHDTMIGVSRGEANMWHYDRCDLCLNEDVKSW